MAVRWLSSMAVGETTIDDQHKELFVQVNALLEACENGKGKDEINKIMDFLTNYVVDHFGYEEGLMEKYNYPDMANHIEIHKKFVSDFLAFKESFQTEGITTKFITELNKLGVDWLVKHIADVDKKLGEFLEEEM